MTIKILIIIMLSFALSGCIYPVYRTIQPTTKVEVLDTKGVAIHGAKVYLSTKEFDSSRVKVEIVRSDEEGISEFEIIKKWGTDMLVMHGIKPENSWSLCVERENYKTQIIQPKSKNDFAYQRVILHEGQAMNCLDERVMIDYMNNHKRKYK